MTRMISSKGLLLLLISLPCLLTEEEKSISKEEWSREVVVEVEGGLEQARLAAESAGLQLLGEVLPESGLWHMRQPKRCKRSPGEVQPISHLHCISLMLSLKN